MKSYSSIGGSLLFDNPRLVLSTPQKLPESSHGRVIRNGRPLGMATAMITITTTMTTQKMIKPAQPWQFEFRMPPGRS